VSADGVTEAIVAVVTANRGDSVQLNLINDANSPSSSSAQDGGLTTIGGSVSSLSNNVSLIADTQTSMGPAAFAIYVAPTNYARGSQNFPQDNTSVQRSVSLQTICLSSGGSPSNPTNNPVTVARPPVVLVHGLWDDSTVWNNFAPNAGSSEAQLWPLLNPTSGFSPGSPAFKADYSACVPVGPTTPVFGSLSCRDQSSQVLGSALGFEFNAPIVLKQIFNEISTYASNIDIAAVQADVVAHSMGGDITRTMAVPNKPWSFLTNGTYGQGPIEKLITIGTPHLGSPLAGDLLPASSGQDPNSCMRRGLEGIGDVVLQVANVAGTSVNGGVSDMVGDGQDTNGLSIPLQSLQTYQSTQPFPMSYIGGSTDAPNLEDLNCLACLSAALKLVCLSSPLVGSLTPTAWNSVFENLANDAIVPLASQTNLSTGRTHEGVIHSLDLEGIGKLDFDGPAELEYGPIASDVVDLLNEPKSGSDFQY
jgi:pimeloyl-ACP methyl ester carboxylesterase